MSQITMFSQVVPVEAGIQGKKTVSDILLSCLFKGIQKLRTVLKEIVLKIFLRPPER